MKAAATDHRLTTRIVAGLAVVALIVHLLTIHRYGYFRDELYYIACARHLDFGYVDLAPLSAFLLRIELILFSSSLFALRIFPALASAVTVALAGMLARELGGRVWAITLACTGMLGSLFFLAVGNFYSPNVYEPLFWTGAIYLLCRIINGAPSRTWIWLGAVAGLGIQNKHSMVFFGVAIALAILLTPERRQFGQKWIWLTGLIAFVIALPNIIWQIERSWPTWVLLHGIAQSHKNVALTPWEFFAQQITLMNPATFPLWFGGLIWLLASREGRRYRVIAFTYLIALAEFIVMHGKNYYLAPAYPMLFAAGGVAFEKFSRFASDGLNRPLRFSSLSRRSFSRRSCFPFYDRKDCSLTCARFISRSHGRKRRIPRPCLSSMPINSAGKKWCARWRGFTPACLRRSRNALPFFVRIMAKRARSIFLARNTDYRQRSPAIKIIFTGDPVITPAKS